MEFVGRMVTDGNGNLLADEGEHAGEPIAYDPDTDTFVFIGYDEPSHNERFHLQFASVDGTQDVDPDLPGYAGTEDSPTEGNEHHFSTGATEEQGIKFLPDKVAALTGGHTDQHKQGGV